MEQLNVGGKVYSHLSLFTFLVFATLGTVQRVLAIRRLMGKYQMEILRNRRKIEMRLQEHARPFDIETQRPLDEVSWVELR